MADGLGTKVEADRFAPISDLLSLGQVRYVRSLIPNSKECQDVPYFSRDRLPGGRPLAVNRLDLTPGQTLYQEDMAEEDTWPFFSAQLVDIFDPVAVFVLGSPDPVSLEPERGLYVDDIVASLGVNWSRLRSLSFKNAFPASALVHLPIVQHRGKRPLHVEYDLSPTTHFGSALSADLGLAVRDDSVTLPKMEGVTVVLRLDAECRTNLERSIRNWSGWSRIKFEMKEDEWLGPLSLSSCRSRISN